MRAFHIVLPAALALLSACGGSDTAGPPAGDGVATVVVTAPASSLQVGQSVQFSAEARNSKGALLSAGQVTWGISPSSVATITSGGLVTAMTAGNVTVSATIQNVTGNLSVAVADAGIPTLATVFMPGNSFSPFNVSVRASGTVRFTFPSEPHNVIFNNKSGAPADIQVTSNVTVNRVFGTIGIFPYDCTIHPGMSGQVTVVQ